MTNLSVHLLTFLMIKHSYMRNQVINSFNFSY